ncbi:MAG TPA: PKD domain-containing protein [Tepidisphaeraceae bacterium]|jgi:PKD repeat protein
MNDVSPDLTRSDRRTALEPLESRQLMSGVTLDSGVLRITGLADQSNAASVRVEGNKVYTLLNGDSRRFGLADVKQIRIAGGDAADVISVDASVKVSVRIQGLGGDDRLGGGSGRDIIEAGAGQDTVYGNGGRDAINGGAGRDRIYGNDGNDSINGGSGADLQFGSAGDDRFLRVERHDKLYGGRGLDTMTLARAARTPMSAVGNTASGVVRMSGMSLVNADTGRAIEGFEYFKNGSKLDLAKLPARMSVRANLAGGTSSTVRFDIDGNVGFRTETSAPYALGGDASGKFIPVTFSPGQHTIVASTMAGGSVLSSKSVTFTVIAATPAKPTKPVKPTPAKPSKPVDNTPTPSQDDTTNVGTPVAVIKAISRTVPAGTSVHVDALSSQLKGGLWNDGKYAWDFGDSGGRHNVMRGFNAAHAYDQPGTYAVSLTVTNAGGKQNTTTLNVTVTAAARRVIYVSAEGSDKYDGSSTNRPIKTIDKALSLLDDNTEILFQRGDTFTQDESFRIKHSNVLIGAYGSGRQPKIVWNGQRQNNVMFYANAGTENITVQDLSINTIFDQDTNDSGTPMAFKMCGTNFTARRNTLLNLQYGFMLNAKPTGVLIQDNSAPLETGLRKYFAWVEGDHITIVGNDAANSTREHIVRMNYVSMINVSDNDLRNISRREIGDYWDYRKPALNVQSGEFAYAYNNKIDSSFQIGPLGQLNGMKTKENRFKYVIGESNEVFNEQIGVNHGAEHVTLRDNVVHNDNGLAIAIDGYDSGYGRGVVDLSLENNTVVNNGTVGNFIHVYGKVDGIRMTGNVYLAPKLQLGTRETAAVKLEPDAYGSFTKIDGNVWPVAASIAGWIHEVAMNYVGVGYTETGFKTADEWNGLRIVGDDVFRNVTPTASYSLVLNGVRVGAKLAA